MVWSLLLHSTSNACCTKQVVTRHHAPHSEPIPTLTQSITSYTITGGIEKFLAKENFRKILNVSHFYSGFSLNKNHNQIKHSNRVTLEFSDSYRVSLKFSRSWSKNSN